MKSKCQKGVQPKWNESLMLSWNSQDLLQVQLFNKDKVGGKCEEIGAHILDIMTITKEQKMEIWIPLLSPLSTQKTLAPTSPTQHSHIPQKPDKDRLELVVEVKAAKDLHASDSNGFSDPFCSMRCGEEKMKTFVSAKTLAPSWNQTFIFGASQGLTGQDDFVLFVKDYDRFSVNDFLGAVAVPLSQIVKQQKEAEQGEAGNLGEAVGKWYRLKPFPGQKTKDGQPVKGEIFLSLYTRPWSGMSKNQIPEIPAQIPRLQSEVVETFEKETYVAPLAEQFSTAEPSESSGIVSVHANNMNVNLSVKEESAMEDHENLSGGASASSSRLPQNENHKSGIKDVLVEKFIPKGASERSGRLYSPFFEMSKTKKDIGRLHLILTFMPIPH